MAGVNGGVCLMSWRKLRIQVKQDLLVLQDNTSPSAHQRVMHHSDIFGRLSITSKFSRYKL